MRDHGVWRAGNTDKPRQCTGINTRNADTAIGFHPCIKMLRAAEIGWVCHVLTHNRAKGMRVQRLDIFGVGADIANMREGEVDDLSRIRRVGHDFLISGHGGVEANFTDGLTFCTKALAPDDFPGRQNQYPRRSRRRARRNGVGHDGVAPVRRITAMSLRDCA